MATNARPEPQENFTALETMPRFLEEAAAALDGDAAYRPGPDGGFSLVEHAWHLADLEREGYGARIRRLQEEADPLLPDFDGDRIARERAYRRRPLREGLAAFAAARRANLATLRSLPGAAWERAGAQEGVGRITLGDIPRMMAEHDAAHRDEITALRAAAASTRAGRPRAPRRGAARGRPPGPARR